jgi:hypothetical protein
MSYIFSSGDECWYKGEPPPSLTPEQEAKLMHVAKKSGRANGRKMDEIILEALKEHPINGQ